jgi:hypothetical protein
VFHLTPFYIPVFQGHFCVAISLNIGTVNSNICGETLVYNKRNNFELQRQIKRAKLWLYNSESHTDVINVPVFTLKSVSHCTLFFRHIYNIIVHVTELSFNSSQNLGLVILMFGLSHFPLEVLTGFEIDRETVSLKPVTHMQYYCPIPVFHRNMNLTRNCIHYLYIWDTVWANMCG